MVCIPRSLIECLIRFLGLSGLSIQKICFRLRNQRYLGRSASITRRYAVEQFATLQVAKDAAAIPEAHRSLHAIIILAHDLAFQFCWVTTSGGEVGQHGVRGSGGSERHGPAEMGNIAPCKCLFPFVILHQNYVSGCVSSRHRGRHVCLFRP